MTEITAKLVKLLKENKEARDKIYAQKNNEDIIAVLKENGLDLTLEELTAAEKELAEEKAKLSENASVSVEALAEVAGGIDYDPSGIPCPRGDWFIYEQPCDMSFY